MNGWLIYDEEAAKENKSYIDWFILEADKQGIRLQLVLREFLTIGIVSKKHMLLYQNEEIRLPEFVINRTIDLVLLSFMKKNHIICFNSLEVAQICNHKSLTHLEINELNIPMAPTYFYNKHMLPKHPPLPYPFILKEATGRSGKQVFYIENENQWDHSIATLSSSDLLIQSTPVQLGKDVRVFVIGKEIIEAVLRVNQTDFRANYKLGGKAIPYQLSAKDRSMIQKIIDHFDFGLVGIDFLISKDGELLFNEIEDVVGSRILSEVSDVNLLEKYIAFIKTTLLERAKTFVG
ncbi:ATP-grasp domain-containing protein [Pseudogracilibacillus sp. SE30717A]|uniref:ATP-grasp domain-containing protein n=1 Tax=Pseudogracilibacillus sp. SE30717A TaxID=3098293 RepID=UPI00300E3727